MTNFIYVICEGQSERGFVEHVLSPYIQEKTGYKGLSEKVRKAVNFSFGDEGKIRYTKEKVEILEKRIQKNAKDILR